MNVDYGQQYNVDRYACKSRYIATASCCACNYMPYKCDLLEFIFHDGTAIDEGDDGICHTDKSNLTYFIMFLPSDL